MYSRDNLVNFFLSHCIADYSAKFGPALDQKLPLSKLAKLLESPADGRPHGHPPCPSSHHRQFPMLHVSKFLLVQCVLLHLTNEAGLRTRLNNEKQSKLR